MRSARLLVLWLSGVSFAILAPGCGDPTASDAPGQQSQASTYNDVDCDSSLTELDDDRLTGISVLDPTTKRISNKERIRHLNELARFSDGMLGVLRARHVPIELTGGSVVEFAEFAYLRGQVPRGWEGTQYTWDSVPGTGTEKGIFLGDSGKPNNAWSLALHEGTHSVDRVLHFSAKNPRLRALYNEELARPQAEGDPNARYRRSNIEEFFAVAVDEFACSAKTRERLHFLYPTMEAFIASELDGELKSSL